MNFRHAQAVRVIMIIFLVIAAFTRDVTAQRTDGLDMPLLAANMCGDGNPGDTHFTFAATGDTFPHENIQAVGEAQGYDYLFDYVRPFLQAADIAYTNFDGAMLAGSPYTGYPAFNFNPALAPALRNAGIGVVSTANNHILDRGPYGLDATLAVLDHAGILQHGTVSSNVSSQPRPAYLPLTLTRDGVSITIGFLSFTWGTNGLPDPYNQVNLLWASNVYGQQGDVRPEVLAAIAQARRETDLVIVAAHWGYEYQFYPDSSQIEGARRMAEAGADVILGAQSHTLQPVDVIETDDGRQTLVIYSLANFLASQGALQVPSFSATSVIFYVGIIRHADGSARVSGYRYLPTIHVDHDTRPAPIPAQGQEDVLRHVRLIMRDFDGVKQVAPLPPAPGKQIAVCPTVQLADGQIGGDFAQYLLMLNSDAIQALAGSPLGPVTPDLTGDCQHTTSVLLTERQRLEWHPAQDWPYRVVGTQIGTEVYRQRYLDRLIERRLDLDVAIADDRLRAFYARYGGLALFGYPISTLLIELDDQAGQAKTVQYFERARLELVPNVPDTAPLLEQVQLGLLGREYAGSVAQCGTPPMERVAHNPPQSAPHAIAPPNMQPPEPNDSALTMTLHTTSPSVAADHGTLWLIWCGIALASLLILIEAIAGTRYRRDRPIKLVTLSLPVPTTQHPARQPLPAEVLLEQLLCTPVEAQDTKQLSTNCSHVQTFTRSDVRTFAPSHLQRKGL